MADPILVQEASTTFQNGPISPQVSQTSLYSSPELLPRVDSYQTGSSLGPGKTSDGLSSSFVLISDESHSGEQQLSSEYVEISERAAVVNKSSSSSQSHHDQATLANTTDPSSRIGSLSTNTAAKRGSEASHGTVKAASPLCLPGDAESATTASEVSVQKWLEESVVQHSTTSPGFTVPMEMAGGLLPLKPKITSLSEVGTQTAGHSHSYVRKSRDGTTQTLPEIKDSKDNHRQPTVAATTPTSILDDHAGLDDQISPLNSPGDEVVDMSASTVLIERHISQKEGRMLKSNNKELRLKIKKLTDVLEQMQKENKRLKNEIESGPMKIAEAQSAALADKEREYRCLIEEMEERQEMEIEQYQREIRKAAEYEERAEEKLKENARLITELQKTISELQEQLVQAQDESKQHLQEVEVLDLKLKACETRASVTESENSVLNEKVNHLMKELTALKKSKHHHHHHHQHSSDERHPGAPSSSNGQVPPIIKGQSIEDVATKSGKEQELTKEEKLSSASQYQGSGGDDISKLEANLVLYDDLKASTPPKPKPRQRQSHQPHKPQLLQALAQTGSSTSASSAAGLTQKASKPDKQGRPPNRPPPVQALVAPKLQSVAHLQPLQQLPTGAKYGQEYLPPYYHHHDKQQQALKATPPKVHGASVGAGAGAGAAAVGPGRIDRPSFLPLKGKSPPVPLQLVEHQAHVQPPPPLSEAQKLAATANWVQQLPEPKEIKQKIENQERKIADNKADKQKDEIPQASVLTVAGAVGGGNDLSSLSEERIEEITRQLKGDGGVVCECPICGKVLHSRESDYGVLLHVELCLQQAEAAAN